MVVLLVVWSAGYYVHVCKQPLRRLYDVTGELTYLDRKKIDTILQMTFQIYIVLNETYFG